MALTGKINYIKQLVNEDSIIGALAIDQRGALKKMITKFKTSDNLVNDIVEFKKIVSSELTQYASSILLDPEYGSIAAEVRSPTKKQVMMQRCQGDYRIVYLIGQLKD